MRRLLVGSTVALASLFLAGAAVLVVSRDLRSELRQRLGADDIGEGPIRLAVAGDVGTGGDAAYRTAEAMDRREAESEYAALLLLGDNVYPAGDPDQLGRTVFDPFAEVLDGDTRLLAVSTRQCPPDSVHPTVSTQRCPSNSVHPTVLHPTAEVGPQPRSPTALSIVGPAA